MLTNYSRCKIFHTAGNRQISANFQIQEQEANDQCNECIGVADYHHNQPLMLVHIHVAAIVPCSHLDDRRKIINQFFVPKLKLLNIIIVLFWYRLHELVTTRSPELVTLQATPNADIPQGTRKLSKLTSFCICS